MILAILTVTAAGLPIAVAADRSSRGLRLLAEGFLFGSGFAALSMYFITLSGIRWSLLAALATLLLFSAIALFVAGRTGGPPRRRGTPVVAPASRMLAVAADLTTALMVAGYSIYATAASPWEWDYWAIWGLKARTYLLHGGIDWEFIRSPWNSFIHADYPPLVPLFYDFALLFQDGWNDLWLGMITVAFVVAALLVVRHTVGEATGSPSIAAVATLAGTGAALTRWVGMAEAPLIAFATAGVLLLWRGVRLDRDASLRAGALLLGFASLTKNEGLSLLVAATVAVALSGAARRKLLQLWPGYLLTVTWQVVKFGLHLQTDLFEGDTGARIVDKTRSVTKVFEALGQNPPDQPLYWFALVLALLLGWRYVAGEGRVLSVTIALQLLFYVGSYVVTPHDVFWHVANSWARLLGQVALLLTAVAALALARDLTEAPIEGDRNEEPAAR